MGIRNLFRLSAKIMHDGAPSEVRCTVPYETMDKNAETVLRNSQQARSTHLKFSDALCKETALKAENTVIMGPPKEKSRLIEKAVARYEGDIFQVSDATRSRILIDSPKEIKLLKDVLNSPDFKKQCVERNVTILSVEDLFEKPTETGWRAVVVKTEIDIGKGRTQKAETVIMPRGWIDEYDTTHTYLTNIRSLKDRAKAQNRDLSHDEKQVVVKYTDMAQKIHTEIAMRDGYMPLLQNRYERPHLKLVAG